MKKIIFVSLLFLILVETAYALPTKIHILNLEYENNELRLINKITKWGYYPDRKIQPDSGFTSQIISVDNEILYNFKFDIPTKLYVDITDPVKNELSGGIVKLNKTEFALIVPHFKEAKGILFYDEKNNEVLSIDISEERLAAKSGIIWLIAGGILLLIVGIFLFITRKK